MPQPRNPDHPTRRPAELRQGTCKIAAETKGGSWAAVPCGEERTCIVRHNGWGSNIQNANSLRKTPPPQKTPIRTFSGPCSLATTGI